MPSRLLTDVLTRDPAVPLSPTAPGPDPLVRHLGVSRVPPERLFPALRPRPHENLLLSGGDHPLSRYSFFGLDPFLVVRAWERRVSIESLPQGRRRVLQADPFGVVGDLMAWYRLDPRPDLPSLWAGAIGYLSYELGRHLERLPQTTVDDLQLPELYFAFYRSILCYDHSERRYLLVTLTFGRDGRSRTAETESRTALRFKEAEQVSRTGTARTTSSVPVRLEANFSRQAYLRAILRIRRYIEEGDVYQVNLSQRFHTPYNGDPYGLFARLYEINPAPFFAYLNPGPFQILCSSPERFLFVRGNVVETRPIKGTLPRGRCTEEDRENACKLLRSEKNRAELAMITDLLRNDLGRVCAYGTVRVEDPARLEAYANVFHLVSIVSGRLAPGNDRMDLLRATFPGGSITGCPKIRAMEIIDELEPTVRSVYTGSIGYLGFDGSMDMNIAIRTLIAKDARVFFQVGGGIVYDSDPEEEYEETLHKAASMKEALSGTCRARTGPPAR